LLLQRLKEVVLAELQNDQFGVENLAEQVGMSRSHLHRKLKTLRGKSISVFIRKIRLEEAMKLLQQDVGNVAEIAYRVGFGSTFLEQYGYPPGEVKRNNQKEGDKKLVAEPEQRNLTQPKTHKRYQYQWAITIFAIILGSILLFDI